MSVLPGEILTDMGVILYTDYNLYKIKYPRRELTVVVSKPEYERIKTSDTRICKMCGHGQKLSEPRKLTLDYISLDGNKCPIMLARCSYCGSESVSGIITYDIQLADIKYKVIYNMFASSKSIFYDGDDDII